MRYRYCLTVRKRRLLRLLPVAVPVVRLPAGLRLVRELRAPRLVLPRVLEGRLPADLRLVPVRPVVLRRVLGAHVPERRVLLHALEDPLPVREHPVPLRVRHVR